MFQKARETAYLESTSFLVLLIRWRKPLLIVTILAVIASFIFSGPTFITPKFRSSVVFFPSATNSLSKAVLDETSSEKQDILAFGAEEQAEQLLQILNSDNIRNTIIERYGLMQHYGIDISEAYPITRLVEKYKDNINFSRTEFMSVRIDVMDTDPKLAAAIANDIASLMDSMKTAIQRSRAQAALGIIEEAYSEKQASMKVKEDSLKLIRSMGVTDMRNQSLVWNEEYAKSSAMYNSEKAMLYELEKFKSSSDTSVMNTKARIKGAEARMTGTQKNLDLLTDYGGASVSLNEDLSLEREDLAKLKSRLEKLKVDANQNLTQKFIVNRAEAAEKKCYPVRWLIVLISSLGAFLLAFVFILTFERLKELPLK